VNIAQRLEALARNFMADKDIVVVLLSGQTLQRIGPGLESFSLGPHVVPGHGGEVELFRLA
jgi:class 3 adenylate cyclase